MLNLAKTGLARVDAECKMSLHKYEIFDGLNHIWWVILVNKLLEVSV